ncbi:LytTR family DNA-binding domain-containing protein [Flavobacterium sp. NG2]|uniref:LytR/AlgR family response regulator transcription factor n=1 Tax=Flavobacterium sp. NG2 TaxID=3097547 RepID=UPI002A801773|nr:LytTR family DNA-binding domain-containing protein [Flavobacterium sp. NG2]WPR72520.1 LytTR family DNA-binding domain-containing protein [Flavobacterium sp. NG2]
MNCIIVDDEELARAIIAQFINLNHPEINILGEFSNAIEAIKFLNQETVDLVFLDIHMPNFTGIDFVQTIKDPPHIILVTSDKNFAIEAFEYKCIIDYLVKPITEARFIKAIEKVQALASSTTSFTNTSTAKEEPTSDFYINVDRRLIKINLEEVTIIEAKGDYIHIKTEAKNYIVHSSLKKIEEKLPVDLFIKVHRSYIINIKKIIDIEDNSILIGKEVVPISRSNRSELLNRIDVL